MLLALEKVSIMRGANLLVKDLDLTIFEKDIIGLIGANGCGKTSLFKAIQKELDLSTGEIKTKKNLQIASLEQEVPGLEISALDYTLSGDEALFKILTKLARAEQQEDYATVLDCHAKLHKINGYGAEAKAAKILHGLGFSAAEIKLPVKNFSGGWRMRLSLAKCLFSENELLLLDEPTNHLDMEAIIWLEGFIKQYPGAILIISHDQDFLDHTVNAIAHISNNCLKIYTGNYSAFEIQLAQNIALQNAQYKKQQAKIAHSMDFIKRFGAKASKARQAQSRMRALEKMELIEPIYDNLPFRFHFKKPKKLLDPILTLKKVDLGYAEQVVIRNINWSIMAKQRIGLLGINGAGKSTLIKGLCGELEPLYGHIHRPPNLVIGYFAQHQVDSLDLTSSPLELLAKLSAAREQELINYLASFGFSRDQSLAPVQQFSGGEKSRVALALIIWQQPNLLLFDEPTNHLDLEMRQALTLALQEYEGTIILVSHDRHLMRTLVDDLYVIDSGKLMQFEGALEDYEELFI